MKEWTVKTDRLVITTLSDKEVEQLIAEETDPEMLKAYSEMLQGCREHPLQRCWYTVWQMHLPDGTPVGDLCFKGLDETGMVEIGYGTYPPFEGKGYMTEAVRALVAWATGQPGVKRIEAETEPDNAASGRVLAKAGFLPTGEMGQEGPRFVFVGAQ